jgi:hypothetical protein
MTPSNTPMVLHWGIRVGIDFESIKGRPTHVQSLQAEFSTTSLIGLLTEGRAAVDTELVVMRHRSGSFKRVLVESNQAWDRSSIG